MILKGINKIKEIIFNTKKITKVYLGDKLVYLAWPLSELITGESPLTLTNSIMAKFNIFNIKGNTKHDGTPKSVTGNIEVKVQNKNLFDKNNVIENELYSSDGSVINNNSYCRSSIYVNCHGFQHLTISGCGSSSNAKIILYDKDKQYVDYYSVTNRTIQIPNNVYYFRISIDKIYLNSLQVEKGSTATSSIAHQEQTALFTLEEGQELAEGDYLAGDGIHKATNLAEEQVIPYTQTQQEQWNAIKNLTSYDDTTHISSENEVSPVFEVQYYKQG